MDVAQIEYVYDERDYLVSREPGEKGGNPRGPSPGEHSPSEDRYATPEVGIQTNTGLDASAEGILPLGTTHEVGQARFFIS
jgi:hypothetical protein